MGLCVSCCAAQGSAAELVGEILTCHVQSLFSVLIKLRGTVNKSLNARNSGIVMNESISVAVLVSLIIDLWLQQVWKVVLKAADCSGRGTGGWRSDHSQGCTPVIAAESDFIVSLNPFAYFLFLAAYTRLSVDWGSGIYKFVVQLFSCSVNFNSLH